MKFPSLVLLPALALAAGCSRHGPEPAAAAALPPARVSLAAVAAIDAPVLTEVTGTVRPAQRAQLAAQVMGTIADLPVALGQRVAAGDRLLKISAAEIDARVAQARAQANVAQRDLARERDLLAKGASTADLVRSLEDRAAGANAMLREAETMLGYTELRAPFAGTVVRKFVNAGDLAAPGHPLLELEGTGDLQIETGIPDSLAGSVKVGDDLLVQAEAGASFPARVAELSSAADSFARTVTAKLAIAADAPVRSGQFVRVHVPSDRVRVLLVPAEAVSAAGQLERVFVAANGRAELRLVKTGGTHDGRTEILAGLAAGESVVVRAPAGLREGQPLEVSR
ncbi:efflux RND transporter periplasmic adaptor subunit [Oleiharenicola sp. Vm1]|uniref:efflux RND transporter periplasmic adaptor subunit n=1 Tax=Oleiharenicola sp. Vm1 TaxID=3398393 RepID=UPI0039F60C70